MLLFERLSPPADGTLHFLLRVGLLHRLAFVVQFSAAGQGDFDAGEAAAEVEFQGDERAAALLGFAGEFGNLAAVQQQFARAFRFVIEAAGLREFGDVAIDQPDFAVVHAGVGLFDRRVPSAQAFHFGADEHDAGLDRVHDFVLVPRATVTAHDRLARFVLGLF